MIEKNKVVELTYELKEDVEDSVIIEKVTEEKPLSFIFGAGLMLPKFEQNIEGLKVGSSFDFKLKSEDAYGKKSPDMIMDLPLNLFEMDGKINFDLVKEGALIPMMDNAGNRLNGLVLNVGDESVKMDFNHPMSDKNLHFKGEIVNVRDANDDELASLVQSDSCSSCGGECSSC